MKKSNDLLFSFEINEIAKHDGKSGVCAVKPGGSFSRQSPMH